MSPWRRNMWHGLFIAGHALTGTVALVAGCLTLVRRGWFHTYLASLTGMELFLLAAIVADWDVLGRSARVLFLAFAALGAVMLWQAELARRCRPEQEHVPAERYVERIGFTLVSLFDAFIVILVLNAGAPVWLVVTAGVAVAISGHFGIRAARARLCRSRPESQPVT